MKTFEFTFTLPTSDIQHDMLTTMLGEIGFDSFMDEDGTLKAYCTEDHRDEVAVEELLRMDAFTDVHRGGDARQRLERGLGGFVPAGGRQ